ncbi:MAG: ferrous iron transport protein A [Pirellula sp.]|nr:ferrous iron transport protein A [Pirellula sp.]
MKLSQLAPGQSGIIDQIIGEDALASRLMEMGLLDGEPIEVIGRAPMGDPTEYALRGYRISLRRNESDRVEVSLTSPAASQ